MADQEKVTSDATSNLLSTMTNTFSSVISSWRSFVYDALILKMTTRWYEAVLTKLPENSTVLDVGIGTAGALLRCSKLLKEKNIHVVGVDYDADYIASAKQAIEAAGMQSLIEVECKSVYDLKLGEKDKPYDAVYFSGSFSLLPDRIQALRTVSSTIVEGKIFITQTYQRKSPPMLSYLKPLLKYLTTIDFGQLLFEKDIAEFFSHTVPHECDLKLVEHDVIPHSLDTPLQAAYLTILEHKTN